MSRSDRPRKVVDETTEVRCALGKGIIREEVWLDAREMIVRYNLTFINHSLCAKDRGRVLGYDNSHGHHHRHYAGKQEKFSFITYEKLMNRFLTEVRRLRQEKDPI